MDEWRKVESKSHMSLVVSSLLSYRIHRLSYVLPSYDQKDR